MPLRARQGLPWWKFVQDLLLDGSWEEGARPLPMPMREGCLSPARPAYWHVTIVFTVPVCQLCRQVVTIPSKRTTANVVIRSQVARASSMLLPSSLNELLERGG